MNYVVLKIITYIFFFQSWVCKFEKPKTSPNSLVPSTTVLSPYIKFGCLSSRVFYYKLKEVGNSYYNIPEFTNSLLTVIFLFLGFK